MGLESHPSLVYISGLFLYWVFYKCVAVSMKVTVFLFWSQAVNLRFLV